MGRPRLRLPGVLDATHSPAAARYSGAARPACPIRAVVEKPAAASGGPEGWPVSGVQLALPPVAEGVYLLHLEPRYRHAGHYLGWAANIERRVAEHSSGHRKASPLLRAQLAAGGAVVLARVWLGETRTTERRLKDQGGLSRHCPVCRASGSYHR